MAGGRRMWAAAVAAAWCLSGTAGVHAAAVAVPAPAAAWHVRVNGRDLGAPAPVAGGQVLLPVGALARVLGAVVTSVGGGTIALASRAGPPQAHLAAPQDILLAPADLGPGYALSRPAPAAAPAPVPGDASARIAVASAVYALHAGHVRLPSSVAYAPAEVAVTAAEYGTPAAASAALAQVEADVAKAGWPGVAGPLSPADALLPAPIPGAQGTAWSADQGRVWLWAARVDNWVVASAVGGAMAPVAWTLWVEQVHRILASPLPTPSPAAAGPLGAGVPLPATSQGPLQVVLDGAPLGTAVWTTSGYALPADALAQALGLALVRTGRQSLNLQGPDLVDGGATPAVIAPPRDLVLSPATVWGIPYRVVTGQEATNAAIASASPAVAYALAELGRLGGYSLEYDASAPAAAAAGAPQVVALGLVEFSTAAGANRATKTEAAQLGRLQKGAVPLALGDLNGAHGNGPVVAVTARVAQTVGKGRHRHTVYARVDWFLYQVDNWEVLVGAAAPEGFLTPRTVWPYLAAVAQHIELDGQPAP
ncbi:MAG: hypothetical protein K6V73_12850 [Firmicutes bacterium]|nr:hypothetical protein [Bacillota bacterium]